MSLLDATELVAFFQDEPGAEAIEKLIRSRDTRITVINLAEFVDISIRRLGHTESEVTDAIGMLLPAMGIVELTEGDGWEAGRIRARRYIRSSPLSTADCFLLACAKRLRVRVVTSDTVLASAAQDEGLLTLRP